VPLPITWKPKNSYIIRNAYLTTSIGILLDSKNKTTVPVQCIQVIRCES